MKRLNPLTGTPFVKGVAREDGHIFRGYQSRIGGNGYFYETWQTPAMCFKDNIRMGYWNSKRRARDEGLLFDISVQYLLDIYPEDGLCPILKTPMVFGTGRGDTPSLDRLVPGLGYVQGNVCWISMKANTLKSDITDPAVFLAIANYVSGCTTQHNIEVPQ